MRHRERSVAIHKTGNLVFNGYRKIGYASFLTAISLFILLSQGQASTQQNTSLPSHGFSMFGQLKYQPGFTHFDYVNPNAPKGGEYKFAILGIFDSLNPFVMKGKVAHGMRYCFATLLEPSGDEPASYYGYVAEWIRVAPDFSWVVFNLNPNARFNNGEPITADDIIFSFNTLREKGIPLFKANYKEITKVEKISDHQIKFYCPDNKSREIPAILGQIPALSKKYYERHVFEEATLAAPVCSGPYEVYSVGFGRFIIYKRVQNWWGQNIPSQKGRHNFDQTRYDYYRDMNSMFEAFKNGLTDVRYEMSSKTWFTGYDFSAVKEGRIKKELIKHSLCFPGGLGFVFNTRREIFADRRVRQAITEIFDFNWINKNLFYNQYQRALSHFPNTVFVATGLPKGEEKTLLEKFKGQIPEEIFKASYSLPDHKNEEDIRKSKDKALALLKEAGWEIKNQQLINMKTDKPFVFEVLDSDHFYLKSFLHLQRCLRQIGIEMKIRRLDTPAYQDRIARFDFDMIMVSNPQRTVPGKEQFDMWGSQAANISGAKNYAGIHDKVVDELIKVIETAPTFNDLIVRTRALDRVLLWGYYMIPAWYKDSLTIAYWDRFGRPSTAPSHTPFSFETWWVDEKKENAIFSSR